MKLRDLDRFHEPWTAFTLIELLVVISVIMILAGIILPVTLRSGKMSRRIACRSNLAQIGKGLYMYSLTWYRVFPPNRPYPDYNTPTRPASPAHGDDDLSAVYTGNFVGNASARFNTAAGASTSGPSILAVFNCPSTTDNAQDYPSANPPKIYGEDIKFKRSDKDSGGKSRGTQLSYEYVGEFNPGLQYGDVNPRVALLAYDDDGVDVLGAWATISGVKTWVPTVVPMVPVGKSNHRGEGGNVLFLDGRTEWVRPADWDKRLLDGLREWKRLTGWGLGTNDKS
jgi:prepilin-type processing-associated H-X9-DG protein